MAIPNRLYKYRTVDASGFTEALIVKSEVYFASPKSFNDPFDCRLSLDFSATDAEFLAHVDKIAPSFGTYGAIALSYIRDKRALKKARPKVERFLAQKFKQKVLVELSEQSSAFCMSEVRDSILMYSHYADSHRGCCLEFDFTRDPLLSKAEKVRYYEDFPELNFYKLHGPAGALAQNLIQSKAKQWEYENEWRAFRHLTLASTYSFDPACLTGVIFGASMTDADQQKLRNWVSKSGARVQFYRAQVSKTEYKLDIVRV